MIESFNSRLWDERLNVEVFFTLEDVREKLTCWQQDYDLARMHSTLAGSGVCRLRGDRLAANQSGPGITETARDTRVSYNAFLTPSGGRNRSRQATFSSPKRFGLVERVTVGTLQLCPDQLGSAKLGAAQNVNSLVNLLVRHGVRTCSTIR